MTKFGVRFDVFNDSTIVDISRSNFLASEGFFPDIVRARYPRLAKRTMFSDSLSPDQFANLLGRAVVGNLRAFILACARFSVYDRIGLPEVTRIFLDMATDHYWPLMEEVAPKLGVYQPLIEPTREVIEAIIDHISRVVKDHSAKVVPDRVLIHRDIVSKYAKLFEILEYLGFIARRDASRGMKSGGRGPVFAINLCNILDGIRTKRVTLEMIKEWLEGTTDIAEIHISSKTFSSITLPALPVSGGLMILDQKVDLLRKSKVYPYGLTENMVTRLQGANIITVGQLASVTDGELDRIDTIGPAKVKRIRDVVYQAVWM